MSYQKCIDALKVGNKDGALDIFADCDLEIKLNIIFTLLVYSDTIGEAWGRDF